MHANINLALMQIRATPLEPGLHYPAIFLYNHPIMGIRYINNLTSNADNDDNYYMALAARQQNADKNYDTLGDYNSIPIGSPVAV